MTEDKVKGIVVVTDGWGPKYGGINAFNTGFCKGLSSVITTGYSVVCAVPSADEKDLKDAKDHNVELLQFDADLVYHVAHHINMLLLENIGGEIVWWVGHDVISGAIANYGSKNIGGPSAVFQHMAYWQYSTLKSEDGNRTAEQDRKQQEIGEDCDLLFGVGPLLSEHACRFKDKSLVKEIIPGLPEIVPNNPPSSQFNAIIFGRMNKDDDIIKQGRLGAKAFGVFAKYILKSSDVKANLTVIGLPGDEKDYKEEYDELTKIVGTAAKQTINVVPLSYSDNRHELFNKLAQHHVCLMLSWHEGFGLVGWEAIAAEVPLIISKNTGLYKFLDEKHHPMIAYLHPVDIKNIEDDVDTVVDKLRWIERNREKAVEWAKKLKEYLLREGYTWENAARTFAEACGIPVKARITAKNKEKTEEKLKDVSVSSPEVPEIYFDWLTNNYGYMDAEKLHGKGAAIPLSLPEIFIPLYAYDPGRKAEKEHSPEGRQEPVDLEALIAKNDYLLIEGHAGSGKTTLLKHLTYCLANKDREDLRIDELDDYLPVLILFKDLEGLFNDTEIGRKKDLTAEDILTWYFHNRMGNVLNFKTVNRFLKAKKAIFLIDGLDEILPEHRDKVVNIFADLRIKHKGNKVVFSGRPHGLEGAVVNKFGSMHIKILALNMEQVNRFINKWFIYLYPGSSGIGGKNAQAMIGEIKDHPAIEQLIDNPLMLTAICILYHDGKELPGQRAELYKKFIDNLLYRRFNNPEIVHEFLKTLAFKMHESGARAIDRSFAEEMLKDIYKARPEETDKIYERRIKETFDDIEPRCGLLKFEGGQYNFWHLTFQEFLTARYIMDNSMEYGQAIKDYWANDWYKEVIELYIGYLSMENKRWANQIVSDVVDAEDKAPYKRWLLAGGSLIDIHRDRRNKGVLDKVRKRLLSIIDASPEPDILVKAGETLGWLGDIRNSKEFIEVEGGQYELEDIGKMEIAPFEIGKYPLTNAWFEEFIKGGGYKNKDYWSKEGRKWLDHTKAEQPWLWNDRKWKCPNSPVVGVSWYEAYAFTRWLTIEKDDGYEYRLLTEEEWQAAAAGLDGRKYSWGDEWDRRKCNNGEIKIEKISPVGIFKEGNTPDGISDLSGNVWEWTLSDYHSRRELNDFTFDKEIQGLLDEKNYDEYVSRLREKERQLPVLRGGSWDFGGDFCRCADRSGYDPGDRGGDVGFRCARTLTL